MRKQQVLFVVGAFVVAVAGIRVLSVRAGEPTGCDGVVTSRACCQASYTCDECTNFGNCGTFDVQFTCDPKLCHGPVQSDKVCKSVGYVLCYTIRDCGLAGATPLNVCVPGIVACCPATYPWCNKCGPTGTPIKRYVESFDCVPPGS